MIEWITSEHKPLPQRRIQARLIPAHDFSQKSGSSGPRNRSSKSSLASSDDNEDSQGTGSSSITSTHRQTCLEMGQRSLPKEPSPNKKALPNVLTAIQDKLAKDQPKIGGYLSRMGVKPVVATSTGHTSTDKKASTSATKPTTPKTTSTSAARSSAGNKGLAKSKNEPLVSIAVKIPRGSRAKPIPPKQAQALLQSTGSKSASPSTPYSIKEDTSQSTEGDLVIVQPSSPQHPTPSTPLVTRPRKTCDLPQTIVLSSSPPYSENDSDLEYDITETLQPALEAGNMVREPSILTIESSKTFSMASDIPSIEVDAIERWVGGVQQALDNDDDETVTIRATNPAPGATSPISSTRQQPSTMIRPATPGVMEVGSSSLHVIPSTFDEQEVEPVLIKDYERSRSMTPQKDCQVRVLAPDSLSWTASAPRDLRTGSSVSPTKGPEAQDDISTIVGGQPTQDTFGLRSLPSFVSDREHMEQATDEQERNQEEPGALPSGLTSSCLQELGLLKRRVSDNNSPRKRRTNTSWNSELGSDPLHEDLEVDVVMAQQGHFPSSIGAAPSTPSQLSYNYGLASIDEDSPKYQPMARLRQAMEHGKDGEGGDNQESSRNSSSSSVESMRGQESYEDFHRRILADARAHVLDSSQPSQPSMPSMTGLSTLPSLPSIPSLPTLSSFSSMPLSIAFHEQEPTQEP